MPTDQVLEAAAGAATWQQPLYEKLHAQPELSMQEEKTAEIVAERLAEAGYAVQRIGGGVVGVLENGDGPTALFRADMDGLPVKETTGLEYASTATQENRDGEVVPTMHACGHDMHVVAGLGAAQVLADHRDAWSGAYVALFQPGEETAEGAKAMVAGGLLEAIPRPDVALGQHVLTSPEAGKVMIAAGPVLSTAVNLTLTVHGKGSHGSMPHLGVDPVVLAAAIVTRIQTVVSREIAPSEFGVVTVGSLVSGSTANIIPDTAVLKINFRAYSQEVRDTLTQGVERIVRGECAAAGCPRDPEFAYTSEYPLTDNDEATVRAVREAFVASFGDERVEDMPPQTASEDFSVVPRAFDVPYAFWGFGGFAADQEIFPNHNSNFAPAAQPTLTTGTQAALAAALAFVGT